MSSVPRIGIQESHESEEQFTAYRIDVAGWGFNVGIGDGDLTPNEMRKAARALLGGGLAVIRVAKARGDDDSDPAGTLDAALDAAVLALDMARALLDAAVIRSDAER